MERSIFQSGNSNIRSEKEENDMVQGNSPNKFFNQLLFCRPYPQQSSVYYRIIVTFFYFLFIVNLLLTFKFLVDDSMFLGISIQTLKVYLNSQNYIWFGAIFVIKAVIVGNIFIQIMIGDQKQRFKILSSTTQKIKKILRLFIELDFHLSSLLILTQSLVSVVSILISISIIVFSLVFLQNYSEQKDRFYLGNFYYFTALRFTLIFGALSHVIALFVGNIMLFFMAYHLCASILIIFLYLLNGWIIYKDTLLRWGLLTFISMYFSIAINLFIYVYCVPENSSFATHCVLTLIVTQITLYLRLKSCQMDSTSLNSKIQQQCFTLFNLLQASYFQLEQKAFISGLFKTHSVSGCRNQKCYALLNELYDSKQFKICKSNDFILERVSLSKFYLQCKFETHIQSHPRDSKVLMSYCELLYWKFRNISKTIYWLQLIKKDLKQVSFGTLIKFNGLLDIVKRDSQNFCDLLYDKNLDIEHLIDAEDTYSNISSNINIILRERLQTWKFIEKQQIDLSLIREKIQPTFTNIASISQNWKGISKYLKHSSRWKQLYLFFILYIKNEKMKNKILQQFESTIEKDIDLHKFIKGNNNFQLKSLFSTDTYCINVCLNDSKAFIKRVSNNFTINTEYTPQEIINADINILLPKPSALQHQKAILSLQMDGKFLDQTIYQIKQVYIVNKSGFIIPVVKIFKEFVALSGELQYVCFFKTIERKQATILCDKYFAIQHFTQSFINSLQISKIDSQYLKKMNLLSMIPKLIQKSKFFSQVDDEIKKQKTIESQEVMVQLQYNKDNLAMNYLFYQKHLKQTDKTNLPKYLELIKSLQTLISQDSIKLELSILINYIQNSYCRYYQIKINQTHLRKQLKDFIDCKMGNEIDNKLGIESTTSFSSKNIRSELTKQGKVRQNRAQPLLQNIFIKQEGNQAPKGNVYMSSLKKTWILFLILLGIVINSNLILLSQKYVEIEQFSIKIQSVLQINSISSNIIAYYQSYLLNVTTFPYIKPKIKSFTTNLQAAIKNPTYQKVIFDKQINTPGIYYPITSQLPIGNFSFNQIDLIFFMQSLFQTLAIQTNLTVNTPNYKLLMNYFYPSFIKLTNNTKTNLHSSFQKNMEQISNSAIITYSIQSLLIITVILSSVAINLKFFRSMFQMMKIHCQINPKEIRSIIKYYKKLLAILNTIQNKADQVYQFENQNLQNVIKQGNQARQNNNLNNRSKDIRLGRKQINNYIFYIIKVSICLVLLMGFSFCSIYYLNLLVQPIIDIQSYGYTQFLYNPNRVITSLIISNQYIYPKQLASSMEYKQIMSNAFIQSNIPYIAAPLLNTKFYTYVQNVYFTNLCKLFQNTLKINNFSFSQCQTIASSSFTRGTISYSGFQYDRINKIFTYNQTLTKTQIKEFYRSLQFSRLFFSNLVSIWQTQIFDLCEWSLIVIRTMLIVLNIVVVLAMIFSFVSLFSFLDKEYKFYKQFYRNMMPQYIISGQKIIKSKLAVISFL